MPIIVTNRHSNTNCYSHDRRLRNLIIWLVLAKEKLKQIINT